MRCTALARTLPARLGPALAALALLAPVAAGGTAQLVAAEELPTPAAPAARAAALGLPAPASAARGGRQHCAADVTGQHPVACFPARDDADDYIAGRARPGAPDAGNEVALLGYGGTSATSTGYPAVGRTCTGAGCGGTTTTWWSPSGSNCTHAYPDNDYYRNSVSAFGYAENLALGAGTLNCNRMVLYRNGTQSGAGALDCGSTGLVCGSGSVTYQSLSWHNG